MAGGNTHWSADVPVSMPMPVSSDLVRGVLMDGFVFTSGGMAHDIPQTEYVRLSTPDWQPRVVPSSTVYEDVDLDLPPASTEVL